MNILINFIITFFYIYSLSLGLIVVHMYICRTFKGELNKKSDQYDKLFNQFGLLLFFSSAYIDLLILILVHFKTMITLWVLKIGCEEKLKAMAPIRTLEEDQAWLDYQQTLYICKESFGINSHLLTKDPVILLTLRKTYEQV